MKIERQLTSKLPWISRFSPTIQEKFNELRCALGENVAAHHVYLTRQAVEEIAFGPFTPEPITRNFIEALKIADGLLAQKVPPFRVIYKLSSTGLTVVTI